MVKAGIPRRRHQHRHPRRIVARMSACRSACHRNNFRKSRVSDVLARILARMSVSASWNSSHTLHVGRCGTPFKQATLRAAAVDRYRSFLRQRRADDRTSHQCLVENLLEISDSAHHRGQPVVGYISRLYRCSIFGAIHHHSNNVVKV